jgi:phosphoribosylformylglycinamidine (FGAM) synthase-like enzyme
LVDGVIAVPDVGAGGITRAAAENMFPVFTGESGLIVKVA